MLIRLGRMMNVCGRISVPDPDPAQSTTYDFTAGSMPSPFQYYRSDTVATYVDDTPEWIKCTAANEARFHHDAGGNPLGVLMEVSRTNKTAQKNFAPDSGLDGITVISGSVTVSLESSYSGLSTATIDGIPISGLTNGDVIKLENTGGTSASIQLSTTTGNTNAHSYRVLVAGAATGSHGNMALSNGTGVASFSPGTANVFQELTKENITVDSSARYVRWSLPAGKTIYMIGFQFEEGAFLTSPIVTGGATATRTHNRIIATDITQIPTWNEAQGSIVGEFLLYQDYTITSLSAQADQYLFSAQNGSSGSDGFGVYMITPRGKGRARAVAGGSNAYTSDIDGGYRKDTVYPVGISWVNGASGAVKAFVGPGVFQDATMAGSVTTLTRLYVGGRDTSQSINGCVRTLRVYDQSRTLAQMLSGFITANDRAVTGSGQSNMAGNSSQQNTGYNGGERAYMDTLDSFWGTSTRNWLVNGSVPGTSIAQWTAPSGSSINYWKEIVGAYMDAGGVIEAIIWDQGTADLGSSTATLKAGWLAIFNDMRAFLAAHGGTGSEPVIICPEGRRENNDQNYNPNRQAQKELADENAWIHLAPEKWLEPLDSGDGLHLEDDGYADYAPHVVRKVMDVLGESVSGRVDGPVITGVSRLGTMVTVTLSHDGGTDFTPTTGIDGFAFLDDGVPITITAAVRTNATTITLTLASAPTGVEEFYHGYRALYGVNPADLVVDNEATYPKALHYYYEAL